MRDRRRCPQPSRPLGSTIFDEKSVFSLLLGRFILFGVFICVLLLESPFFALYIISWYLGNIIIFQPWTNANHGTQYCIISICLSLHAKSYGA